MVDLLIEGSTQPTPGVSHLAKVGPSWAREIGTDSVSLFLPGSWCLGLNLLIGVAPLPFQLGPLTSAFHRRIRLSCEMSTIESSPMHGELQESDSVTQGVDVEA